MAYFLGLDSGGTKTDCWLGNETEVLARASGETVKLTRVGPEIATGRLSRLLREVSAIAGVPLSAVERTCVGLAGYSIESVRTWARRVVEDHVGGEVLLCGDEEIALDAAFHGGPGILIIGGTGSNVVGRCGDGRRFTAGGWGPGIGDEGSGFWIGREAVREAFRAIDEGVHTTLLEAVRERWGVKDQGAVVGYANERPGPDFAGLVPGVVRCAETGDALARCVLERAGDELARMAGLVWRRMRAAGEREGLVAYTGSVLEKIAPVRERMIAGLAGTGVQVQDAPVNALDGALWRARVGC